MPDEMKEKSIAVVGVSQDTGKYGYKIFKSLLENSVNVFAVGVRGGEVLGKTVYKSIKDLPIVPELVITVVPPVGTELVVEQAKEIGVKEIWMQPGSDSETAVKKAESYGINVTHRACYMRKNGFWTDKVSEISKL